MAFQVSSGLLQLNIEKKQDVGLECRPYINRMPREHEKSSVLGGGEVVFPRQMPMRTGKSACATGMRGGGPGVLSSGLLQLNIEKKQDVGLECRPYINRMPREHGKSSVLGGGEVVFPRQTPMRTGKSACATGMRGGGLGAGLLWGGEFLFCQFGVEGLLPFGDVVFVAGGIDEGIGAARFHSRVFVEKSEVGAVGAQENVARQGFEDAPHAFVVAGDLRIGFVAD